MRVPILMEFFGRKVMHKCWTWTKDLLFWWRGGNGGGVGCTKSFCRWIGKAFYERVEKFLGGKVTWQIFWSMSWHKSFYDYGSQNKGDGRVFWWLGGQTIFWMGWWKKFRGIDFFCKWHGKIFWDWVANFSWVVWQNILEGGVAKNVDRVAKYFRLGGQTFGNGWLNLFEMGWQKKLG